MRSDDGPVRPGIVNPGGSSTSPGSTRVSLSGRQSWQVPLNLPLCGRGKSRVSTRSVWLGPLRPSKCRGVGEGDMLFVRYQLAVVVPDTVVQVQSRSNLGPRLAPACCVHPRVIASQGDMPLDRPVSSRLLYDIGLSSVQARIRKTHGRIAGGEE